MINFILGLIVALVFIGFGCELYKDGSMIFWSVFIVVGVVIGILSAAWFLD